MGTTTDRGLPDEPLFVAAWWHKDARMLAIAAGLVEGRIKEVIGSRRSEDISEWMGLTLVHGMLAGMAAESALKGIIVLDSGAEPPATHDLAKLIRIAGVPRLRGMDADEDLEQITQTIKWRGRYPMNLKGSGDKGIVSSGTEVDFARDELMEPVIAGLSRRLEALRRERESDREV